MYCQKSIFLSSPPQKKFILPHADPAAIIAKKKYPCLQNKKEIIIFNAFGSTQR